MSDNEKKVEGSALKAAIAQLQSLMNYTRLPVDSINLIERTITSILKDFPDQQKQLLVFIKPLLNDEGDFISPAHKNKLKDALMHWFQSGELIVLSKEDLPPPLEDIPVTKPVLIAQQNQIAKAWELTQPISFTEHSPTEDELKRLSHRTDVVALKQYRWITRYLRTNKSQEPYDLIGRPKRMALYEQEKAELEAKEAKSPESKAKKLYYAARRGQLEVVRKLIAEGAPVNQEIQLGKRHEQRPLSGAAYCTDAEARLEIIRLLLESKASPRFSSEYGNKIIPDVLMIIGAANQDDVSTAETIKIINNWLIAHPISAPAVNIDLRPLSIPTPDTQQTALQGDTQAQYQLGVGYEEGWGVRKNLKKAGQWYQQAAAQGHPDAQCCLGYCYERGLGELPKDLTKAFELYQLAAAQGIAQAQYYLGLCYARGLGVETNWTTAVHWYELAAAQGLAQAEYELGVCYAQGLGAPPDEKEARRYFSRGFWQLKQGPVTSLNQLKPPENKGAEAEQEKDTALPDSPH